MIVEGETVAEIGKGLLALVAISRQDVEKDLQWMAKKIVDLRIFEDGEGKMNLSVRDVAGQLLLVSQFTLYGDCRKGRRPSFIDAAVPAEAEKLYSDFVALVRQLMPGVQTGKFQAIMDVRLANAGPVTIILDSRSG